MSGLRDGALNEIHSSAFNYTEALFVDNGLGMRIVVAVSLMKLSLASVKSAVWTIDRQKRKATTACMRIAIWPSTDVPYFRSTPLMRRLAGGNVVFNRYTKHLSHIASRADYAGLRRLASEWMPPTHPARSSHTPRHACVEHWPAAACFLSLSVALKCDWIVSRDVRSWSDSGSRFFSVPYLHSGPKRKHRLISW